MLHPIKALSILRIVHTLINRDTAEFQQSGHVILKQNAEFSR
jgi:hypothetical protein